MTGWQAVRHAGPVTVTVRPAHSDSEAQAALQALPPLIDTASNRRLQSVRSLEATFAQGQRSAGRTWLAVVGDERRAAVGARVVPGVALIDVLAGPERDAVPSLLAAATAWARDQSEAELSCYAGEAGVDDPRVPVDEILAAGWTLTVSRHQFELTAAPGRQAPTERLPLRLTRASGADRPRLLGVVAGMLSGSLDVRDRSAVERHGEGAAARLLDHLIDADPVECIRIATDHEGNDVGLVSWRSMGSGTGYLTQVGVVREARGRGYGRALVAEATRQLLAEGSRTLVATTDATNLPMVRAFQEVGWPSTETRLDFALR